MAKEELTSQIRYTRRVPKEPYAYEEFEIIETVPHSNLAARLVELQKLFSDAPEETFSQAPVLPTIEDIAEIAKEELEEEPVEPIEVPEVEAVIAEAPKKRRGRKPKAQVTEETPAAPEAEDGDLLAEELKPAKKLKTPNTPYDKANPFHRKLVSDILNQSVANWKSKGEAIKKVSASFVGRDLIDGTGDVLPEFEKAFVDAVKQI